MCHQWGGCSTQKSPLNFKHSVKNKQWVNFLFIYEAGHRDSWYERKMAQSFWSDFTSVSFYFLSEPPLFLTNFPPHFLPLILTPRILQRYTPVYWKASWLTSPFLSVFYISIFPQRLLGKKDKTKSENLIFLISSI